MLVQVVDATGAVHVISVQGQDETIDFSGDLDAQAVGPGAQPQQVAPANQNRAGFLFQNTSGNPMLFFDLAGAPGWFVASGGYFPPLQGYPLPTGVLSVQGLPASAEGDTFTYREWQNGPDE